jgi:tetratricopeptide (TPR) repeat protein
MTRAERLIWLGLAALPLVATLLLAVGHFTGEGKWQGQAPAVTVMAWPPAVILFVAAARFLQGRQPAAARWLVLLALYGVAGWVVIATADGLIESHDAKKTAGGWALMGLFVAPVTLGLLALAGSHMRAQSRSKKDYYDAISYAARGRSGEAVEAFSRHQRSHPADPQAWEWLGFALLLSHRYEEALDAADRAIQMGSSRWSLWIRGDALLAVGAADEALAIFDACARKRGQPRFAQARGIALIQLRRLDDAVAVLHSEKGWRRRPYTAFALGEAYRLSGNSDAALEAYEVAALGAAVEAAAHPRRYRALQACALTYTGKLTEAEEAAQSALAVDASEPSVLSAQALIQRRRDDLSGLEATIELMVTVSPSMVVLTLGDPEFTPLLVDERFRRLLGRAWLEQNRLLERIRSRPRIAQSGA